MRTCFLTFLLVAVISKALAQPASTIQREMARSPSGQALAPVGGAVSSLTVRHLTAPGISNFGSEGDWLARSLGFPPGPNTGNTLQAISPTGGTAALFAARSSDNTGPPKGMVPALSVFMFNDNTVRASTGYGLYLETRHFPGAGITQGMEVNSTNIGPSIQTTPYAFTEPGLSASVTASAGRDDIYPGSLQSNPSVAFAVLGAVTADVRFNSGLVFAAGSVAGEAGIDMPEGLGILMRSPSNGVAGRIRSDATANPGGASIIFVDKGLAIQDYVGTAQFELSPTGVVVPTLSSGSASFTGGWRTLNGAVSTAFADAATGNILTQGSLIVRSGAQVNGQLEIWDLANKNRTVVLDGASGAGVFHGPIVETSTTTPTSSSSPCQTGQHAWDANYEYRCVFTNSWKRAALSSW